MNDTQAEEGYGEKVPLAWIMTAQAWAWTVSCVGGVGNLLTICAIAYQLYLGRVWRRRYGPVGRPVVSLEGDTILLLHLSICDFLYCVVNLPLTAITYDYSLGRTPVQPSKAFCTGAALFRYVNALAEWTTLGLLTVQRCVDLGRSRGARFFRPRPTLLFIAGIWVVSVVLQLGAITQNEFAYDTVSNKCDLMSLAGRIYFFSMESLVPCGLMLTGCCSIIFQIWKNTRKLLAAGMSPELVSHRFHGMMKSTALLLMLLFLFLVCVIPICVYSVDSLLHNEQNIPLGIALFMVYWIQYGVNFLVYAVSNDNYRAAYKQFLMLLMRWAVWVVRMGHGGPRNGTERSKDDMAHPHSLQMSTVIPLGSAATSLALLPLGECKKDSTDPYFPISTGHCNCPYQLPCLRRLRNCHSVPSGRANVDHRDLILHSWPMWRNGSQSTRSSVITLESTVQHDSEASTTITSIPCVSPTTTNIPLTNTTDTPFVTHTTTTTTSTFFATTDSATTSNNTTTNTNTSSSTSTSSTKISATVTTSTFTTTTTTTTTATPSATIVTTTNGPITTITTIKTDNTTCGAFATTAL